MFDAYTACLQKMRKGYDTGKGQRDLLQGQLTTAQTELTMAKEDIVTWEQSQLLLGKVSDFAKVQMVSHVEGIVSAALFAVFGEGYTFRINLKTIGNQAAAEWQVITNYGGVEVAADPESSHGGGLVDVISIALRLAMLEILRPHVDGPLLCDEPGKHLSSEYAPNLAYFLKQYAAKTGRQVIMVSHSAQLIEAADRSYEVTQKDGISEVKQLS